MASNISAKQHSFYLPAFTMLFLAFFVICMFGQDRLLSLPLGYVPASIFFYPFACSILDIITEIYGYKVARKTVWMSLVLLVLIALVMFVFSEMPGPKLLSGYEGHFNITMRPVLKNISIAALSIIVGQYLNIYIFGKLYSIARGKYFALRSIASSIIGDTLTLIIAIWVIFFDRLTGHEIFVIITDEIIIMYGMAVLLSFPAAILVSLLKKHEPHFSEGVHFNPFSK
jgi:uncharacterized integral membrane protein (TIGR00697 family)